MSVPQKNTNNLLNNYRCCMQELMSNHVFIPEILLEQYQQLKLDDTELVQILRIVKRSKNWSSFTLQLISEEFAVSASLAEKIVRPFLDKGLISELETPNEKSYSFDGLFEELAEIWFYTKSNLQKNGNSVESGKNPAKSKKPEAELGKLFKAFEKEFGRGLSPMENDKLSQWLEIDGLSQEVVMEALRRAVLQGKTNFNYIDRILLNWQKQNLHTVSQIEEKDRHPAAANLTQNKKKVSSAPKSPYDSIYKNRIYK